MVSVVYRLPCVGRGLLLPLDPFVFLCFSSSHSICRMASSRAAGGSLSSKARARAAFVLTTLNAPVASVTYDHGYATVPGDVAAVALSV